jgi:hypothetical protein
MLIVFPLQMSLEALVAARGRVPTPRPDHCPACGHERMTFAGWWTKHTRYGPVDIHRAACAGCAATHSCWPDVLVGGRIDTTEVIGAALVAAAEGAGHRSIAATLGLPPATVRNWLRRARRLAAGLCGRLAAFAATAYPVVSWPAVGPGLAKAVAMARLAAEAFARLSGQSVCPWRLAVRVCGGRLLG